MHALKRSGRRGLRVLVVTALVLGAVPLARLLVGASPTATRAASADESLRSDAAIVEAARELDAILARRWASLEIATPTPADDATFARRVHLDIVGRIPTEAEFEAFLSDRDSDKRERLIDSLLASPGRWSHDFNEWADVLRLKSRPSNQVSGEPYLHWLKESLAANEPYDQLVYAMLAAEGSAYQRGNGATGYLLRDRGMPLDNMAMSARIFLGTRIECAQCHDHPTEPMKQRQFFELAAFAGGLRYNHLDGRELRQYRQSLNRVRRESGERAFRAFRRSFFTLSAGISGTGNGFARLPSDYAYDDAEPGDLVTAKSLFADPVELHPEPPRERRRGRRQRRGQDQLVLARDIDSRLRFAQWVVADENPRFTRVIVNRLWERHFGEPLTAGYDDLKDDILASNPDLEAALVALMQRLDYDLVAFRRVVLRTKAYQAESVGGEGETYAFQGPRLRRLTAEQIWDSLVTLVVPDLDATLSPESAEAESWYRRYEAIAGKTPQELAQAYLPGVDDDDEETMDGTPMAPDFGSDRRSRREAVAIYRRLQRAERRGDREALASARKELDALGIDVEAFLRSRTYGRDMVRASEVRQPAPPGHFLREFGQSDRETPESRHRDASVPQALRLMNGFVEEHLFATRAGLLRQSLESAKAGDERIRAAYRVILSREPSRAELRAWKQDLKEHGDLVYQDLVWTLVNSQEFRFQS